MLENQYQYDLPEAGCDEAGRGCLAGPVFAAAVMLPPDFHDPLLNDSKQMTERNREKLRAVIEREAVAWAVEAVSAARIDRRGPHLGRFRLHGRHAFRLRASHRYRPRWREPRGGGGFLPSEQRKSLFVNDAGQLVPEGK